MRCFSQYCRDKLEAPDFRNLYDEECHVCRYTMQIFGKMIQNGISVEQLAVQIQSDPEKVQRLMDAEYCDPHLTVRLCRHLDLPSPAKCNRMVAEQQASD